MSEDLFDLECIVSLLRLASIKVNLISHYVVDRTDRPLRAGLIALIAQLEAII